MNSNTIKTHSFDWMYGIEEYLRYVDHPNVDTVRDMIKAVINGDPWAIKTLVEREVYRGVTPHTSSFLRCIMANLLEYDSIDNRKILQYICHCIDDDFLKNISIWSMKYKSLSNFSDHFSRGQIKSKLWLVDKLHNTVGTQLGNVVMYGGWYAMVAYFLFEYFQINSLYNLELDPSCVEVADYFNRKQCFNENWRFKTIVEDVSTIVYNPAGMFDVSVPTDNGEVPLTLTPDIIINTSCEHMSDDWFYNLPSGTLVALQTNDYFDNDQHINCVSSVDEMLEKYKFTNLMFSGELETYLYTRFMAIGRT